MTTLDAYRALHGRPRGFIEWGPHAATRALVDQVTDVLREYADYLPLTLRQVFYRLVSMHGFAKTEGDYRRLCEVMTRARRARLIDFDAIRDDGFSRSRYQHWRSPRSGLDAVRHTAENFTLDRQRAQPIKTVIWCEAGGMVPMLERVAEPYSVPVFSSGGFDSVSAKHAVAREFLGMGNVHVLHIGDHDPSGVHVSLSLAEDVRAFMGAMRPDACAEFFRLAVIPEQIEAHGLPTAPKKPTDRRRFHDSTVQAEALPPDALAGIVEAAILERVDVDILEDTTAREREGHAELTTRLGGASA